MRCAATPPQMSAQPSTITKSKSFTGKLTTGRKHHHSKAHEVGFASDRLGRSSPPQRCANLVLRVASATKSRHESINVVLQKRGARTYIRRGRCLCDSGSAAPIAY